VLFVSHNMGAVARLCDRAVWLDRGQVAADEPAAAAIQRYLSLNRLPTAVWTAPADSPDGSPVHFLQVRACDPSGQPRASFAGNDPITIEVEYQVLAPLERCQIGARITNSQALVVFSTGDSDAAGVAARPRRPGRYRSSFVIPRHLLPPETYGVMVAVHEPFRRVFEAHPTTVRFEVTNVNALTALDNRLGAVAPLLEWQTGPLDHAPLTSLRAASIGIAGPTREGVATGD
jgi:lipopolysaccharide transport system ATP-binding protein